MRDAIWAIVARRASDRLYRRSRRFQLHLARARALVGAAGPIPVPRLIDQLRVVILARAPGCAAPHRRALERLGDRDEFWRGATILEDVDAEVERRHGRAHDPHEAMGRVIAPALAAFARHCVEQAIERRSDGTFFLAREGATILRMYRRLARALGVPVPRAAYLAVNRRLTFLAGLDEFSARSLAPLWAQYPNQSPRVLLRNCSLEEEVLPLLCKVGIEHPDAPSPGLDALAGLFESTDVRARFVRARDTARALLNDYLRARGLVDARAAIMVDIGWRGSIQTNIERTLAASGDAIHGVYMGLRGAAAGDSSRHGYLCDTRSADWMSECVLRNNSVFEMFATARHGSVVGYARRAGGRVDALVRAEPSEAASFAGVLACARRGVQRWFEAYADLAAGPGLVRDTGSIALRPAVLDRVRRFVLYPTGAEARAFLDYTHVENFGEYGVSGFAFGGSRRLVWFGGPPWGIPARALRALRSQRWPEGVCRRSGVPLANLWLDLCDTRRYTR